MFTPVWVYVSGPFFHHSVATVAVNFQAAGFYKGFLEVTAVVRIEELLV